MIHAENNPQVLRNAYIALEAGCDGVFLINQWAGDRSVCLA